MDDPGCAAGSGDGRGSSPDWPVGGRVGKGRVWCPVGIPAGAARVSEWRWGDLLGPARNGVRQGRVRCPVGIVAGAARVSEWRCGCLLGPARNGVRQGRVRCPIGIVPGTAREGERRCGCLLGPVRNGVRQGRVRCPVGTLVGTAREGVGRWGGRLGPDRNGVRQAQDMLACDGPGPRCRALNRVAGLLIGSTSHGAAGARRDTGAFHRPVRLQPADIRAGPTAGKAATQHRRGAGCPGCADALVASDNI